MTAFRVGAFAAHAVIGRGSAGEVWSATHLGTGAPAAIKVLRAEPDPTFVRAFRAEARAVAALRHPGIVEVYDYGTLGDDAPAAGAPYLAMERLAETLAPACGALDWAELRAVLLALLDALAHAHARGVLHRDLKPQNVLRTSRGEVRLADFGLAHGLGEGGASEAGGTPAFMAPEQLEHRWRDFGPWTDLYAFGCLGWALATGAPPFPVAGWFDGLRAHLHAPLPPLAPTRPVPPAFEAWLRTLLHKDPRARFACAADAAAALDVGGERGPVGFADAWGGDEAPSRPLSGAGLGLFGARAVPVVGRLAERNRLWQRLGEVHRERRPGLVILRGAAGTGKSCLARWLCERATESGAATAVRATGEPLPSPTAGVDGAMRRHLGVVDLPAEQVAARVDEALGALAPDDRAFVAGVLAPGAAASRPTRLEAAERWLGVAAQGRPVVVWLDDAHWDAVGLELVAKMLDGATPVLFVATVQEEALAERADEQGALSRLSAHPRAATLSIEPLARTHQRRLLDALLPLDDRLAADLAERTAGHPMFAVELLRDWVERGILRATPGGFGLAPDADTAVPVAVADVWDRRIDGVVAGPDDDAALELAAVLGGTVEGAVWEEAARHAGIPVRPDLCDALFQRNLAAPDGPATWSWAHGMLRECLCERAVQAGRWAALNASAAAALSARGLPYAERAAACHAAAGDLGGAATAFGSAAAWRLHRGADPAVALDRLEGALTALGAPDGDVRWGRAATLRVFATYAAGDYAGAEALAGPLLERAERHGWTDTVERARVVLAGMARARLDPDRALAHVAAAAEAGGAHALTLVALTTVEHRRRWREALPAAERAVARAEGPVYASLTVSALAMVCALLGHTERAAELAVEAEARSRALGSWAGMSGVALLVGDLALARGATAEARAAFLRAGLLARRSGGLDERLWAELGTAQFELRDGRPEEAEARLVASYSQLSGLARMRVAADLSLAWAAAATGRFDAAARSLGAASAALMGSAVAVRQLGAVAGEVAALAARAGEGRLAAAARALEEDQVGAFATR